MSELLTLMCRSYHTNPANQDQMTILENDQLRNCCFIGLDKQVCKKQEFRVSEMEIKRL